MAEIKIIHSFLCSLSILSLHAIQLFGVFIGVILFIKLLFSTYWWLTIPYLYWMLVIDAKTPDRDGRIWNYLRNSKYAKYLTDYYPVNIMKSEEHELDPKKNYLFAVLPHGILSIATFFTFGTIFNKTKKSYPNHETTSTGLSILYKIPFYRDVILMFGARACSAESLTYILTKPTGGNMVSLVVGGAEEAFYSWPGTYKTIVKKRKGFVKIALKTGASLVPVFAFGINDDFYYQIQHPKLLIVQKWLKKITNIAPILGCGRYYLPFFPKRVPITYVAGIPIDVEKVENPTQEQIDELHAKFINEIEQIFEKHKHKFVENPDKTFLEYV